MLPGISAALLSRRRALKALPAPDHPGRETQPKLDYQSVSCSPSEWIVPSLTMVIFDFYLKIEAFFDRKDWFST